jgi:hypothetical protein
MHRRAKLTFKQALMRVSTSTPQGGSEPSLINAAGCSNGQDKREADVFGPIIDALAAS